MVIKDPMVVMEMVPELFRLLPEQANHEEYIHVDRKTPRIWKESSAEQANESAGLWR